MYNHDPCVRPHGMWKALVSGLAGACAVTLMNETIRQFDDEAPRLDLLGMRALSDVASPDNLRAKALVSDLTLNTLYYSIVGASDAESGPLCGAALGVSGGIGAVTLPGPMGYGNDLTNRTRKTRALSIAYYTAAGLIAGLVYRNLARA
jgi:hypothetical protein